MGVNSMDIDWSSFHKTLKDKTRRDIIGLLSESGQLSYTDIMTMLHITNTGRLNYHLKGLGNLIVKDNQERYILTEKGHLAVRLLKTFPEKTLASPNSPLLRKIVSIVLTALGIVLVGGIASFGLFLLSVQAMMSFIFELFLGSALMIGLALIITGIFIYKGNVWQSL
jgi:predicted transcriptional regulator